MEPTLDDNYLDFVMRVGLMRMATRKGLIEYLRDRIGWFILSQNFRQKLVAPDWYREETDAEFRTRIVKAQEEQ